MNIHLVKVKCRILSENSKGEEISKMISSAVAIHNAGTYGNAEVETAKFFEQKASPENNFRITGISEMNVHSIFYAITELEAEDLDEEPKWFKIKVELSGEMKPFTNLYLVYAETMQKAQEFVKTSWANTSYDVVLKTSAEIKMLTYIELEGPAKKDDEESEQESEKKFDKIKDSFKEEVIFDEDSLLEKDELMSELDNDF
jgi:hypothetical protein